MTTKYKSDFYLEYREQPYAERTKWLYNNATFLTDEYGNISNIRPNDEWLNPNYDKVKNDPLYQFFIELIEETDANSRSEKTNIVSFLRSSTEQFDLADPFYKLPSIPKSINDGLLENALSLKDLGSIINEAIISRHSNMLVDKDPNSITIKDYITEENESTRDRNDLNLSASLYVTNQINYTPTKHFRGRLGDSPKEHGKRINRNLANTLMADYLDSLQFQATTENAAIANILNETYFIKEHEARKLMFTTADPEGKVQPAGKSDNIRYSQFKNVVIQKVFRVPPGNDSSLAMQTFVKSVKNFTSMLINSWNVIMHQQNFVMGNADLRLEAAGSKLISQENLTNAASILNADIVNSWRDVFANRDISFTNLIRDQFLLEYNTEDYNERSLSRKLVNNIKNFGGSLTSIVHTSVDNKLLLALLDTYKAMDDEGNFIDDKGNITDKPMSVLNFYKKYITVLTSEGPKEILLKDYNGKDTIISHARLKLDDIVKTTNIVPVNQLQNDVFKKFTNINRKLVGNNEGFNRSMLGQNLYGIMIEMYRGWIAPGLQRRFANLQNVLLDLRTTPHESQIFYDDYSDNDSDGYFTTLIRMALYNSMMFKFNLINITKKIISPSDFTGQPLKFYNLSKSEKENFAKVAFEVGMIISSKIVAGLMYELIRGDDDDDKNKKKNSTNNNNMKTLNVLYAISMERTIDERLALSPTLWSWGSLKDILNSPVAGLSIYDSVQNLSGRYSKNYNDKSKAGDLKIQHNWHKLVPYFKEVNRDYEAYYDRIR